MDLALNGKVAIVTGGSRGIGKAVARELAREGASVVIVARSPDALDASATELAEQTGAHILPVTVDTADDTSVRAMVHHVVETLGTVHVLVNSASAVGSSVARGLRDVTADAFMGELNVKVLGYLRCIQAVAPHMIANRWGRIINISGLAARQPLSIIGSSRNAAVVAMAKNAADELGPHGIAVTVVHPGGTLTEHYLERMQQVAASRGIPLARAIEERYAGNLIRRAITPTDIAYVVAFLASPKSAAINGDVIAVAGGVPGEIHY